MIKYFANELLRPTIKAIEVSRETDSSVFIGSTRRAKITYDSGFFDSFEDAKAWLLDRAEGRLQRARITLQDAQDKLGNIKGLKEPQA